MSISFSLFSFPSQKASSHLILVLSFSSSLSSSVAPQIAGEKRKVSRSGWVPRPPPPPPPPPLPSSARLAHLKGSGSSHGEKAVAATKPKAAAKPKAMAGVKRKAAKKPKLKPATKVVKTSAKATPGKKAVEKVAAAKLKKTPAKKPKSVKTPMKKAKK
ncbi:histone H1-like [Syzygium oleosum]|uniref:histone H1-like n=1 Tax=Syzygium oleosum TaxID=219896 RepID=UPI0024BB3E25|nr:histone H1-like [Syzygium oleosum]